MPGLGRAAADESGKLRAPRLVIGGHRARTTARRPPHITIFRHIGRIAEYYDKAGYDRQGERPANSADRRGSPCLGRDGAAGPRPLTAATYATAPSGSGR